MGKFKVFIHVEIMRKCNYMQMKRKMNLIMSSIVFVGVFLFISCTKMDHYYKDYIIERAYVGKPDSIWIQSGDKRVKISLVAPKDREAKDLVVRWGAGMDSIIVPIDHDLERQSFLIEGLEEGSYIFNAYTRDGKGKRSLPIELSSQVFGASFRNTIQDRVLSHSVVFPDSVALLWNAMNSETLYGVEIGFTDKKGVKQTVFSRSTSLVSIFQNADPNKQVTVRTAFRPHQNAFEYFYTNPVDINLITSKRNSLLLVSSEYKNAEYIDFNLVRIFQEAAVPKPVGADVDMAYTLGSGSRSNLFTMDGVGFTAFSADWQNIISQWPVKNAARLKLNRGASALTLYNGLDETNRNQMVAAYDNSTATAQDRVSALLVNDVILLRSTDRGLYVAIKVVSVPPATSGVYGTLGLEFKVSRL